MLSVPPVIPESYWVGENEVQPFAGVQIDPACTGGALIPNFVVCNVPVARLTDGVLGNNIPVNFTQFSAWNSNTAMPRIYFRIPDSVNDHIRQVDMYFFKNSSARIGLPDLRIHITRALSSDPANFLPLPYTIITNQSMSEGDNQTVKVSLVDSIDQDANAYPFNRLVVLTFNFSGSDALDWMLLSEIKLFNDTSKYKTMCYHYVIFMSCPLQLCPSLRDR